MMADALSVVQAQSRLKEQEAELRAMKSREWPQQQLLLFLLLLMLLLLLSLLQLLLLLVSLLACLLAFSHIRAWLTSF